MTHMMKRCFAAFILSAFLLTGCTAVPTNQTTPTTKQTQDQGTNKQAETPKTDTKSTQDTVQNLSDLATIGDAPGRWEQQLGHPYTQGDTLKVYQNGAYKVVFEKDKAVTITFIAKDGKNPVVASMLPRDGEKQSESSKKTGGLTMVVQKWHSNALAAAFPETKGNYTLMKNMNGDAYDSVVVDCTPNLAK